MPEGVHQVRQDGPLCIDAGRLPTGELWQSTVAMAVSLEEGRQNRTQQNRVLCSVPGFIANF